MTDTRRPLIAGNWKMNGLKASMSEAVDQLRSLPAGGSIEERIEAISRDIIQLSQAILKREWVRVKRAE